jgi:hypothetical protein
MRVSSIDLRCLAVAMGLCWLGGCSSDGLSSTDLDGTGTDGTYGTGPGELATDGSADETAAGSTADPEGTSGGDETGSGPSDVCEVDCGEGGSCAFDEEGAPYCVCDPGYAAYGLRCLQCAATNGVFDVDVPSVAVSATFLLAGEPFPASIYERGEVVLRDPVTGDEVPLGDTGQGGSDGAVAVVPGTYEVHYAWKVGSALVPANRGAKLVTVVIPHADDHELIIDVPVVEIAGAFTLGGAPAPGSQYENGAVVLRNAATGDEVPLGDTRDGDYRAMVIPGSYHVHYRRKQATDLAPVNVDARIGEVVIDGNTLAQTLDLDVPVTTLSGSFTIDGQTPPQSIYENGRILLRSLATGDEVVLGQTRDGSYSLPVVPGPYQLVYQRLQGGQEVPVNRAAVLDEPTLEPGSRTLDIDVATAVISGTITVGGIPAPADPGDDGLLLLRNPASGDEALLGNTAAGSYTQRVVRGAYDVFYRQETSGGGVPVNTNARLQAIDVQGGASFDVDVPVVTVSASVTVGGQAPPESVYDDGVLYLRDPATGDSVLLGNTRLAQLQRPVVPGTYELLYVVEAAGPTMPINARSRLDTVEVGPATELEVDIPVAVLQGAVTVQGEAPPQSIYNRALLHLHDVATDDVVYLGSIEAGGFARTLTAGTYVLVYQALASTGLLPGNTNVGLACLELQP